MEGSGRWSRWGRCGRARTRCRSKNQNTPTSGKGGDEEGDDEEGDYEEVNDDEVYDDVEQTGKYYLSAHPKPIGHSLLFEVEVLVVGVEGGYFIDPHCWG